MNKAKYLEVDISETEAYKKGYNKIPKEDFLYPADMAFPITGPSSIPKALHDWGRSKREGNYISFVKKLYNHVKNKHPEWLSAFPEETLKKAGIKKSD